MKQLLTSLLTPYKYGNVEITDSWVTETHREILKERNVNRLYDIRDNVDKNITFQVSGNMRDSLLHLYEFAQYRINLFNKCKN